MCYFMTLEEEIQSLVGYKDYACIENTHGTLTAITLVCIDQAIMY